MVILEKIWIIYFGKYLKKRLYKINNVKYEEDKNKKTKILFEDKNKILIKEEEDRSVIEDMFSNLFWERDVINS